MTQNPALNGPLRSGEEWDSVEKGVGRGWAASGLPGTAAASPRDGGIQLGFGENSPQGKSLSVVRLDGSGGGSGRVEEEGCEV